MIVKYKLSEVAKDLGMGNKEIADILKEYATAPKSNSQVLSEKELNIIFDAVSQKNQIDSLEQVFAPAAAAAEERKRQNEERIRAQQEAREEEIDHAEDYLKKTGNTQHFCSFSHAHTPLNCARSRPPACWCSAGSGWRQWEFRSGRTGTSW